MMIMRKTHHQTYLCFVDNYRRPSRQRNTKGAYFVGAKSPKQAKELLQNAIGFGSILVKGTTTQAQMAYKQLQKREFNKATFVQKSVRHANAPLAQK